MVEDLSGIFGKDLISYALGGADEFPAGEYSREQLEVILELEGLASEDDSSWSDHLLDRLLRYEPDTGTTFLRRLRRSCVAEMDKPDRGDDVLASVFDRLGCDYYAAVKADFDAIDRLNLVKLLTGRADLLELSLAFINDGSIGPIFPQEDREGLDVNDAMQVAGLASDYCYWSDGHGGSLQPVFMMESILSAAVYVYRTGGYSTESGFLEVIQSEVERSRRLISGGATRAVAIVGINNFEVDGVVKFAGGRFRQSVDVDISVLLMPPLPAAILEIDTDLRLIARASKSTMEDADFAISLHRNHTPKFEASVKMLAKQIGAVQLGVLLSSHGDELRAPIFSSSTTLNPLVGLRAVSSSRVDTVNGPFPTTRIQAEGADDMAGWVDRVVRIPAYLEIGMRRLVGATTARVDAVDSFIDAVVCWENLFGTSSGESTFRVCGSMAVLLEPGDADARSRLFRECKKLYEARSKVVHGSKELSPVEAHDHRNRSVDLSIRAFRAVLDRADLLSCSDSALRGSMVMLGFE